MTEFVNHTNLDAYEAFVQSHPEGALLAEQPLGKAKARVALEGRNLPRRAGRDLRQHRVFDPQDADRPAQHALCLPRFGLRP